MRKRPTFSARREAGGWMQMKKSYVERVAGFEALTGETAGWLLSREMLNVRGVSNELRI